EEEALPPRRADDRSPVAIGEAKAAARFDRREAAHEALGDAVAAGDLAGALVLAHGGLEVLPGTARFPCDRVGVRPEPLRLHRGRGCVARERDSAPPQRPRAHEGSPRGGPWLWRSRRGRARVEPSNRFGGNTHPPPPATVVREPVFELEAQAR